MRNLLFPLVVSWLVMLAGPVTAGRAADEPQAELQTSKQRVIGLFSPDRQDALRQVVSAMPELQGVTIDYDRAEATFRFEIARLFPGARPKQGYTVEQITARLDERLRTASRGTFAVRPVSTLAKDEQTLVEIDIGLLDCQGCRYGAYQAVAKIDGVERATVSADPSRVSAWIDPDKTDRAALEAALTKARVPLKSP